MDTRERILDAALRLYNAQGTDTITVRHIAAEIGISHGNLRYHLPTTKDIVRALFDRMNEELNAPLGRFGAADKNISAEAVYQNFLDAHTLLEKYRFILLDLTAITRKDTYIRDGFRKVMAKRSKQLSNFLGAMKTAGLMRDDIRDTVYEKLVRAILMIGYAWLPNRALLEDQLKEGQAPRYASLVFSLLIPFLTKKGLTKFKDLLTDLELI